MEGLTRMKVGQIIKKFRKDRRMTLTELSRKSGVAIATLSRMENGIMTGTLDSHTNICKALEITLSQLYKDLSYPKETIDVQTSDRKPDVFVHDKSATSEMLVAKVLSKKMMPVLITIQRNGVTDTEETKPGVERFVYVLQGKISVRLGDENYPLSQGNTIYFDSSTMHSFKNIGPDEARLIVVTSPPVL